MSAAILSKFAIDMQLDSDEASYLGTLNRLMQLMKMYFSRAAEELREGVEWVLPDWIDLLIHDEIASSDAHIITQARQTLDPFLTFRTGKRCFSLLLRYQSIMKVSRLEEPLISVRLYRYTVDYNGTTVDQTSSLYSPQIAQFTVNPGNNAANVLRDIMFLDEVDLLVVGAVEGI